MLVKLTRCNRSGGRIHGCRDVRRVDDRSEVRVVIIFRLESCGKNKEEDCTDSKVPIPSATMGIFPTRCTNLMSNEDDLPVY